MKNLNFFAICVLISFLILVPLSASYAEKLIPDWVKQNFVWFAEDEISELEIINAIKHLIEQEVILLEEKDTRASFVDDTITPAKTVPKIKCDVLEHEKAEYTVLIYMVASDLEEKRWRFATSDIKEIIAANPSDKINIVLQSGGSRIDDGVDGTLDFTIVQRSEITSDGVNTVCNLGRQNLGNEDVLSSFLVWGTKSYPAEKSVLIFWDHGGGAKGFGKDMIHRDKLSLTELKNAFGMAKGQHDFNFELIGFDACLMSTLELADILKSHGNYLVASQENEGGGGWDYTSLVSTLNENPQQDGVSLGMRIANTYITHTQEWDQKLNRKDTFDVTLSVVDLSKVGKVNESFLDFTQYLTNQLSDEDGPKISVSLRDSARYAVTGRGSDSGQMDIVDFSKQISQHIENPDLSKKAQTLQANVDEAVVYQVLGKFKEDGSNGISINLPKTVEDIPSDYRYSSSEEVIQFYLDYLNEDHEAPQVNAWLDEELGITGAATADDIYEVNFFFTSPINSDGVLEVFASVEASPADFDDGEFSFAFGGSLPAICNFDTCTPVNPEFEWNENFAVALLPIILEKENLTIEADLKYIFPNDSTTGEWEFIGVMPYDSDGVFQKVYLPLEKGDKIRSYTSYSHWETGNFMNIPFEPIIVDDSFGFRGGWFDGVYWVVLEVCDFSENCEFSQAFEYKVNSADQTVEYLGESKFWPDGTILKIPGSEI